MPAKTKSVKRAGARWFGTSRRAALKVAALALVEQLALYQVLDAFPDEPASAREAFDLLVKHGYHMASQPSGPPALTRPDGSVVRR